MPLNQEDGVRLIQHIVIADKMEADWINKDLSCKKRKESLARLIGGTYNLFKSGKTEENTNGDIEEECGGQPSQSSASGPNATTTSLAIAVIGILKDITADEEKKLYKSAKPVLSKLHTNDYDTARAIIGTPRCVEIRNELKIVISIFLEKERKMAVVSNE